MVLGKVPGIPLAEEEPIGHSDVIRYHGLAIRNTNVIEPGVLVMAHAIAHHALASDEHPVGAID